MPKETADTVENDMLPGDYAKRLKAEIEQLQIRIDSLTDFVANYDSLEFTPKTPLSVLLKQLTAMVKYKSVLAYRYALENTEGEKDGN